jgi:hypothetical protein
MSPNVRQRTRPTDSHLTARRAEGRPRPYIVWSRETRRGALADAWGGFCKPQVAGSSPTVGSWKASLGRCIASPVSCQNLIRDLSICVLAQVRVVQQSPPLARFALERAAKLESARKPLSRTHTN